ncbi:hypothetical protein BJ742DRAFT_735045 [Cladochytrium replicatum]|nr:hypothetical protein BJ742DRAFT_735045 [Cladochytrium replicatum]
MTYSKSEKIHYVWSYDVPKSSLWTEHWPPLEARSSAIQQSSLEISRKSKQALWDGVKEGKTAPKVESGVDIQNEISNLRFPEDRRPEKGAKMLDLPNMLRRVSRIQIKCSRYVHRAADGLPSVKLEDSIPWLFTYTTFTCEISGPLNIPQIQLGGKFIGHYGTVALDMQQFASDFQDWCQFDTGVATGGRTKPSAEHAGLMFGFGLNGHLRKLIRGIHSIFYRKIMS